MTDYISRQAAIDSVWRAVELDNSYAMKHQIYTDLKTIPAADVRENVHGAWEYREAESDRWDEIKCPFCKKCYTVDAYRIDDIGFTATDFKFCPNCGAEMRPITALSKNAEIDSNSKRGES